MEPAWGSHLTDLFEDTQVFTKEEVARNQSLVAKYKQALQQVNGHDSQPWLALGPLKDPKGL